MKYLILHNKSHSFSALYEIKDNMYCCIYRNSNYPAHQFTIEYAIKLNQMFPHIYILTNNIDKELAKIL